MLWGGTHFSIVTRKFTCKPSEVWTHAASRNNYSLFSEPETSSTAKRQTRVPGSMCSIQATHALQLSMQSLKSHIFSCHTLPGMQFCNPAFTEIARNPETSAQAARWPFKMKIMNINIISLWLRLCLPCRWVVNHHAEILLVQKFNIKTLPNKQFL